jgi:hypothetical protein
MEFRRGSLTEADYALIGLDLHDHLGSARVESAGPPYGASSGILTGVARTLVIFIGLAFP